MKHNKHRLNGIVMLMTLALLTSHAQATEYNDVASGNWNATNTWSPSSGYPILDDTAVIDSHTVSLSNSLLAGTTAPTSITVSTGGTLALQALSDSIVITNDSPLTLNGGTVGLPQGGSRSLALNGPVTLQNTSTVRVWNTWCTINGPISGAGKLVSWFRFWNTSLTLASATNTDWTGSLDVRPGDAAAWVYVKANRGLGRATANVYANLNLYATQSYGAEPKPTINVYPGGILWFGYGDPVNTSAASDIPVVMNGGQWASSIASYQWYANFTQSGPVTLNSNAVIGCGDYGVRWNFTGPIDGPGQFILQSPGTGYGAGMTTLSGTNTHAGGTWVQSGLLVAKHTHVFGSGTVQVDYLPAAASHGVMQLAATTPSADYWVLTNNLTGDGTFKVEDGAGTNRLTAAGSTVAPGTNLNAAGVLTVDGRFAFGRNGPGGTPAPTAVASAPVAAGVPPADLAGQDSVGELATLRIDVAGVGSTPGIHHDQLKVDHGDTTLAASLTNCVLALNMIKTEAEMNGVTVTVVNASGADFSSCQFASVPGTGAAARVIYASNTVSVTWDTGAPVIRNAGYINLGDTSCEVLGTLVSTGAAATEVRCYWGTNAMDTTGWANTNSLGIQDPGLVICPLTGLTGNVQYYYRFYATNTFGENWAPGVSNFLTLADVTWNDAATGNWNANNANTWGAGTNVYPQSPLNDTVTVDSHTVTADSTMKASVKELILSAAGGATGTLQFVNASTQNQSFVMSGGRLGVYSDDNGIVNNVVLNGNLRIQSGSQLHLGAHGNRRNSQCSTLNGNIEDYGPGTTGVLRVDWTLGGGEPGRLLYNGVSTNFTGGWLINCLSANDPMNGAFWLGVEKDGGLGASTVTVTRGQINIDATQSSTAQRPAPARVAVNPEGRFLINNGVNVTNWIVDLNGGHIRGVGTTKLAGGTVNVNSNSEIWAWGGWSGGTKEFSGSLQGTGAITFNRYTDIDGTYSSGPFLLSGDNAGWSGGLRLLADALTASHTNGLGTGPVLVASQSGGKLTLDQANTNTDWTVANNLSGGCTNGSAAVAIQVEDGAGTNTLTVLGTVNPGTNTLTGATNIASILRVDGSVACGAGSRLKVDISGTNGVAGVDFDRLLVDHDLTGLANAALEVTVNTNLAKNALAGQEFVIVSNATALAGPFASVQWNPPWSGLVRYNDPAGTVKLIQVGLPAGSVLMVY